MGISFHLLLRPHSLKDKDTTSGQKKKEEEEIVSDGKVGVGLVKTGGLCR